MNVENEGEHNARSEDFEDHATRSEGAEDYVAMREGVEDHAAMSEGAEDHDATSEVVEDHDATSGGVEAIVTDFLPALQFNVDDITHFNHFLCNPNCVNSLVKNIGDHTRVCSGPVVFLKEFSLPKSHKGFSNFICLYKCYTCEKTIEFSSSPLLDNKTPVSDLKVEHAKMTSGGEWEITERFTETIGFSSDFHGNFLKKDFQIDSYCEIISEFSDKSMEEARSKVIVETDQIDTTTDASHENRTNSGNSCVTMISPDTL